MNHVRDFIREEDGIGVVEIILILVATLGLMKNVSMACIRHVFSMCIKRIALKTIDFSNDIHNKYEEMCIT